MNNLKKITFLKGLLMNRTYCHHVHVFLFLTKKKRKKNDSKKVFKWENKILINNLKKFPFSEKSMTQ